MAGFLTCGSLLVLNAFPGNLLDGFPVAYVQGARRLQLRAQPRVCLMR